MDGCEWRGEGQSSREGASAHTAMLNKQRQFLPHTLGSYSSLFDFPIHYFLRACSVPLDKAGSHHTSKTVQHLTYPAVCGGGTPAGSRIPLIPTYEVINSNLRLLLPARKVHAQLSLRSRCGFYSTSLLCAVFHSHCYLKSVISSHSIPHTVHAPCCYGLFCGK